MGGNYRGSVVRTAKSFIEIIGLFWVIKIVLNTTNFPNYDTLAPFPSIALSPSLSLAISVTSYIRPFNFPVTG